MINCSPFIQFSFATIRLEWAHKFPVVNCGLRIGNWYECKEFLMPFKASFLTREKFNTQNRHIAIKVTENPPLPYASERDWLEMAFRVENKKPCVEQQKIKLRSEWRKRKRQSSIVSLHLISTYENKSRLLIFLFPREITMKVFRNVVIQDVSQNRS